MHITKQTSVVYTILNAAIMDSGCLSVSVNVTVETITSFSLGLIIPAADTATILDSTILDGKSIRESMITRIYEYLISSGQITGTIGS